MTAITGQDGQPTVRGDARGVAVSPQRVARRRRVQLTVETVDRLRVEEPEASNAKLFPLAATELGWSAYAVRNLYTWRDAPHGAKPDGHQPRRRAPLWTDELGRQAVEAWVDRHGRPPLAIEWMPWKIRNAGGPHCAQRLANWNEPWIDRDGIQRHFPRADQIRLRRCVIDVVTARGLPLHMLYWTPLGANNPKLQHPANQPSPTARDGMHRHAKRG